MEKKKRSSGDKLKDWSRLSIAERSKRTRQKADYIKKVKPKLPAIVHPNFFPIKLPDDKCVFSTYSEQKEILENAKTIVKCLYNIPGFDEVPNWENESFENILIWIEDRVKSFLPKCEAYYCYNKIVYLEELDVIDGPSFMFVDFIPDIKDDNIRKMMMCAVGKLMYHFGIGNPFDTPEFDNCKDILSNELADNDYQHEDDKMDEDTEKQVIEILELYSTPLESKGTMTNGFNNHLVYNFFTECMELGTQKNLLSKLIDVVVKNDFAKSTISLAYVDFCVKANELCETYNFSVEDFDFCEHLDEEPILPSQMNKILWSSTDLLFERYEESINDAYNNGGAAPFYRVTLLSEDKIEIQQDNTKGITELRQLIDSTHNFYGRV